MKFDRIALKITFFVLIFGLILMSNVAISQGTQVPWVSSWSRSSGTQYSNYETIEAAELKDVTFQVTLQGTLVNTIKVQFELTSETSETTGTKIGTFSSGTALSGHFKVTPGDTYDTKVRYEPNTPECRPGHTVIHEPGEAGYENGLCEYASIMTAVPPGRYKMTATILPIASDGRQVLKDVSGSLVWKFHTVHTFVRPPGNPQQPSTPPSSGGTPPPTTPPTPPPVQPPVQPNNAPVFTDGASTTRSIAENTGSGVSIGTAVAATDADSGDTLTYTLGGTDAAAFGIDSTTGQLRTSAALDYETKTSYSVIVTVSDGTLTDSITVTINVTNVNENNAPVFTDGASTTRSIAENTGSGVSIGTAVAATDADSGDTLTYTLGGTDAAAFGIDSTTGQLRTSAALDYETKTSYSVTVSVSDDNGGSDSISVTINIINVAEAVVPPATPPSGGGTEPPPVQPPVQPPVPQNDAPVFTDGTSTARSISENPGSGASIGTPVSATDANNDTLTYTLSGTDAAAFSIDSTTGQLQTSAALDYEIKNSYAVIVTVSDGSTSNSIAVTITVTNVDETVVQPPTNNQGSGGGGGTLPKPVTPINHAVGPFDYEQEGVGRIVFSEWMLSTRNDMPQWIELYNTTDEDINLRGWRIVGRFMDGNDDVRIFRPRTIRRSLTVKAKQSHLIVAYATSVYRGSFSENLQDNVYSLQSTYPVWYGKGIVLELQDSSGTPIDRIGNLSEQDQLEWRIPSRTRHWGNSDRRISLIRRLKSVESRKYNFRFGVAAFGWFPADEVEKLTEVKRSEYFYGRPSDIGTPGYRTEGADPLPVTLSYFLPQVSENGSVVLSWATASEIENAGFNVFRGKDEHGSFVKINVSLIQGAGTTSDRNDYTWIDTTAKPNVEYYYRIEDMSFDGISEVVATQRLKGVFTAKNRALTRWASLKKGTE